MLKNNLLEEFEQIKNIDFKTVEEKILDLKREGFIQENSFDTVEYVVKKVAAEGISENIVGISGDIGIKITGFILHNISKLNLTNRISNKELSSILSEKGICKVSDKDFLDVFNNVCMIFSSSIIRKNLNFISDQYISGIKIYKQSLLKSKLKFLIKKLLLNYCNKYTLKDLSKILYENVLNLLNNYKSEFSKDSCYIDKIILSFKMTRNPESLVDIIHFNDFESNFFNFILKLNRNNGNINYLFDINVDKYWPKIIKLLKIGTPNYIRNFIIVENTIHKVLPLEGSLSSDRRDNLKREANRLLTDRNESIDIIAQAFVYAMLRCEPKLFEVIVFNGCKFVLGTKDNESLDKGVFRLKTALYYPEKRPNYRPLRTIFTEFTLWHEIARLVSGNAVEINDSSSDDDIDDSEFYTN